MLSKAYPNLQYIENVKYLILSSPDLSNTTVTIVYIFNQGLNESKFRSLLFQLSILKLFTSINIEIWCTYKKKRPLYLGSKILHANYVFKNVSWIESNRCGELMENFTLALPITSHLVLSENLCSGQALCIMSSEGITFSAGQILKMKLCYKRRLFLPPERPRKVFKTVLIPHCKGGTWNAP